MARNMLETDLRPTTPSPSSDSPSDGMTEARSLAKRYMSDAVRLLAGIAFAPDSEAPLHTRMLACKQLIEVAGSPRRRQLRRRAMGRATAAHERG
jgi:hypothetical protein